jgi:hypothetical protein
VRQQPLGKIRHFSRLVFLSVLRSMVEWTKRRSDAVEGHSGIDGKTAQG